MFIEVYIDFFMEMNKQDMNIWSVGNFKHQSEKWKINICSFFHTLMKGSSINFNSQKNFLRQSYSIYVCVLKLQSILLILIEPVTEPVISIKLQLCNSDYFR